MASKCSVSASTGTLTPTCALVMEGDALGAHLLEAAVEDVLLQLEVGNAVAQQAADAVVLLEDGDGVAGAAQLLRGGQACRAAADDGDALAGVVLGRLGMDPAFVPGALDDASAR